MRKLLIFLVIVGAALFVALFRGRLRQSLIGSVQTVQGRKTVADRLEQYGRTVDNRLLPYFQTAKIKYPPERIVFVALKRELNLEVWACSPGGQFKLIRTYPILVSSGLLGPKLQQGDRQIPEGLYRIESLNPNSRYHLSLRLSYPNRFDRAQAKHDGRTNLGGDIMIHGGNLSIGCIAVGDEAAEDLFVLAGRTGTGNIDVIMSPVDFRTTGMPELSHPLPVWTEGLYVQIKQSLLKLKSQ